MVRVVVSPYDDACKVRARLERLPGRGRGRVRVRVGADVSVRVGGIVTVGVRVDH